MVGGPLLRIVTRLADRMVGGGLFQIVSTLYNWAGYGPRVRARFLVMASSRLQCSHSLSRITIQRNGARVWTVLALAPIGGTLQNPGLYALGAGIDPGDPLPLLP